MTHLEAAPVALLFGAGEPRDPLGRGGLDVDVCALPRICRCVMSLLLMPG